MIVVDKSSPVPLYRQVYEHIRREILAGTWAAGEAIPSVRDAMAQTHLARNTILNAYQQLCAEGYIESRRGAGYFVADISFDILRGQRPEPAQAQGLQPSPQTSIASGDGAALLTEFDFSYGSMPPGAFCADTWRKLCTEALYSPSADALAAYGEPFGLYGLRSELARYLERSRNVSCRPELIMLTSGIQESIIRLLMLFDPDTDVFAMEDPGFPPVREAVRNMRYSQCYAACDSGSQAYLESLAAGNARLVYTTPSHQMPMGTCQGLDTRLKLLELAVENDAYLIEDDYDSIFRFDSQPLPTLRSLDANERVIYCGTLSKILSPALRIGYVVFPEHLLRRVEDTMPLCRCSVSWIEQEVLRLFMKGGHWQRFVRRVEHRVRAQHAALVHEIKEQMPGNVEVVGGDAGLHLLLRVSNGMSQDELVKSALEQGVRIGKTSQYWRDPAYAPGNLVMLGFASVAKGKIPEGVSRLRRAWFGE